MTDLERLNAVLRAVIAEGGADGPQRIGAACLEYLPVSGASITLMTGGGAHETVFASDVVMDQLDSLQFNLGEGPCVEAFTQHKPVLVTNLAATDGRWPVFTNAVRDIPIGGLYVFPLQLGAIALGVLDLYRTEPGDLIGADLTGALRVADAALWSLLGLRVGETLETASGWGPADSDSWLSGAPLHRTEVYQATGMIIGQLGVSAQTALAKLRSVAFAQNRLLDEVARDVVARRLRFDDEELR